MKKLLNKVWYNTEKSTLLFDYTNNKGWNDFRHVMEEFYVTSEGKFFMRYGGGPLSRYSITDGPNTKCGSEGLAVLTTEQMYCYVLQHQDHISESLFTELVDKYFPDLVEVIGQDDIERILGELD